MIRRRHAQLTLAEVVLFGSVVEPRKLMHPLLERIDDLLADDQVVDQILEVLRRRWPQSSRRGRPGTPAEVVLRLLVLKHLKSWSYEQLEWEVTGNLVYRHFCRINAERVPDSKTMVRLGKLVDGTALQAVFDHIVTKAIERRVTRGRRMRIDTTVVEAAIRYPTDSGLCEDVVRVVRRSLDRLSRAGVKLRFKLRRVGVSVSRRIREIGQALRLRGDRAKEAIKKPYRGLLRVTGRLVRQGEEAVKAARRRAKRLGSRATALLLTTLATLTNLLPRARQVLRQSRARVLRGMTRSAAKLISLFEPDAQILRRGKVHKPTEFGRLVKVQESEGGIVTDLHIVDGKADAPLLVPSVERHKQIFGRAPTLAATDRGFYSGDGERRLVELGVRYPAIPKPGYRSSSRIQHERQRWFRRGRAWRAGGEARISRLKHRFGMARSTYRGLSGMLRTVLWAGIANNLIAIAVRGR